MQITHHNQVSFTVCDHRVPTPQSPAALNALSTAKMAAARAADFTYHAINANIQGAQHYLVETGDDHDNFTLPAGEYASFTMTRANRLALDQFIAHAYRELTHTTYHPAGDFNLETLAANTFTVQIPVAKN